jgi:UDP-N-acetylmuramoyl-tripeptide--D-alanyl-D-alanine ligase
VPLTLLSFTAETEIRIVEMGANHKKKLNFFANWLCLTMDILLGSAHLEGFGGVAGVMKVKVKCIGICL